jgi:hypothetical protein
MRRLATAFYADLKHLRDQYGEHEYHRDQILPSVIALLDKHMGDAGNALKNDAANAILDNAEASEDSTDQADFFNYEAQTALGNKMRIKRKRMNREQLARRKRIIDHNKIAQDRSWAAESTWINQGLDALEGHSLDTVREDVIDENGRLKVFA